MIVVADGKSIKPINEPIRIRTDTEWFILSKSRINIDSWRNLILTGSFI